MTQVLTPTARAEFLALTRDLEGVCTWLYLDVRGFVTVGIGNLVDPVGLLWLAGLDWNIAGRKATDQEVWEAWATVKAAQGFRKRGGGFFRSLTRVRATDESIDQLVGRTIDRFAAALAGFFPEMVAWPDVAQVAVMLMAWALGPDFPHHWPKLTAACRALDFATAAAECHMNDENQNASFKRRNAAVKAHFEAASQLFPGPAQ